MMTANMFATDVMTKTLSTNQATLYLLRVNVLTNPIIYAISQILNEVKRTLSLREFVGFIEPQRFPRQFIIF